jgi:hypothetical protein
MGNIIIPYGSKILRSLLRRASIRADENGRSLTENMIHNESRIMMPTNIQGIFMDDHMALTQLEELAYTLGIQVRYEKIVEDELSSTGGLCRVKGEWVIIINSKAAINEKIHTLVKSLKNFDLNDIYMRPALRELLEKQGAEI